MRLQTVPARRGARWMRDGLRVFFRHPFAFAALLATFLFVALMAKQLPYVGSFIVLALVPLFLLGQLIAARIASAGGVPTARVFVAPLRGSGLQRGALLQLGVVYAALVLAAMWLSGRLDGGAFEALMGTMPASQDSPDALAARLEAPRLVLGLVLRFAALTALSVPFSQAPALVHWDGHGSAKALFASALACWRNRGAFAVFALAWLGLIVGFDLSLSLAFTLSGQALVLAMAALPLWLMIASVFHLSLYFAFIDCFVANDGTARRETAAGAA